MKKLKQFILDENITEPEIENILDNAISDLTIYRRLIKREKEYSLYILKEIKYMYYAINELGIHVPIKRNTFDELISENSNTYDVYETEETKLYYVYFFGNKNIITEPFNKMDKKNYKYLPISKSEYDKAIKEIKHEKEIFISTIYFFQDINDNQVSYLEFLNLNMKNKYVFNIIYEDKKDFYIPFYIYPYI